MWVGGVGCTLERSSVCSLPFALAQEALLGSVSEKEFASSCLNLSPVWPRKKKTRGSKELSLGDGRAPPRRR